MAREASTPIVTINGTNTTANRRISFRLRIIAATLIALLIGAAPAAQSAGSADAQYESLAKAYYDESFRLSPIEATAVGVHDYDDQIGDFSADGVGTQLKSDRTYLEKLATIDRDEPLERRRARRDAAREHAARRSSAQRHARAVAAQSRRLCPIRECRRLYGHEQGLCAARKAPRLRRRARAADSGDAQRGREEHHDRRSDHPADRRRRRGGLGRFLQDVGAAGVCGRARREPAVRAKRSQRRGRDRDGRLRALDQDAQTQWNLCDRGRRLSQAPAL